MTNREKYINNADIVDLYNLLDWQKVENKFGIKINGTNDIYKWLSQEAESTADEMFGELGWNIEIDDKYQIEYLDLYRRAIVIRKEDFAYYKYRNGDCVASAITEAEDAAIHKKIEELKDATKV